MTSLLQAIGELGLCTFNALVGDFKASAVFSEFQYVSQRTILLWIVDGGFYCRLVRRLITLPEPFPHSTASLDRSRQFTWRGAEQGQHFQ